MVAGALSGDARARVHSHIETCAACRTLVIERARPDLERISHPGERLTNDVSADTLPLSAVAHLEHAISAYGLTEPGAVLGPYRIVRALGRGAMGVVYEAE